MFAALSPKGAELAPSFEKAGLGCEECEVIMQQQGISVACTLIQLYVGISRQIFIKSELAASDCRLNNGKPIEAALHIAARQTEAPCFQRQCCASFTHDWLVISD